MKVDIGPYEENRKVSVHIDNYDVWNLDHTLALIIYPALIKLKEIKNSYGYIDDEDVPENLRSTSAESKFEQWNSDSNAEKRYEWFLNELIWVFGQQLEENEGTSKFYDHSGCDESADILTQVSQLKVDREGLSKHQERMQNGFRLFGKYYQTLWD